MFELRVWRVPALTSIECDWIKSVLALRVWSVLALECLH